MPRLFPKYENRRKHFLILNFMKKFGFLVLVVFMLFGFYAKAQQFSVIKFADGKEWKCFVVGKEDGGVKYKLNHLNPGDCEFIVKNGVVSWTNKTALSAGLKVTSITNFMLSAQTNIGIGDYLKVTFPGGYDPWCTVVKIFNGGFTVKFPSGSNYEFDYSGKIISSPSPQSYPIGLQTTVQKLTKMY